MSEELYMEITLGEIKVKAGDRKRWAAHLASVSVTDALDALDAAQVVFELPEGSGSLLVPELEVYGKKWIIKLMSGSTVVKEYAGDVLGVSWSRTGGAPRQATVTCVDHLHRLKRGRTDIQTGDRRFPDKKVSEIVSAVAKHWGFDVGGIESTTSAIPYFEWKGDDLSLLKHLADQVGCVVRADEKDGTSGLVFAKASSYASEEVELRFGIEILEISANHNLDGCVTSVEGTVTNPKKPETITVKVGSDKITMTNKPGKTGADYMTHMGGGAYPKAFEHKEGDSFTQSDADERAKGMLTEAAAGFVQGSLVCRFNPNLTSGKSVRVVGAGWPLDGVFLVKSVTHSFDASGYRSQVQFSASSISAKK